MGIDVGPKLGCPDSRCIGCDVGWGMGPLAETWVMVWTRLWSWVLASVCMRWIWVWGILLGVGR